MLSLLTRLVASSAVAAAAQPGIAEPTKVTKLHTTTDILHAPHHTADADIHARQLTDSFPSPTWSEPSWVLFGAPTASPDVYPSHKRDNVDTMIFVIVLCIIGGSILLFGVIGCIVKACIHVSGKGVSGKGKDKSRGKGKGKGKAASRRTCSADVEMTAGLKAHAAPAEGSAVSEELEDVELMPRSPEPVLKWLPYLTGEAKWDWEK